MRGKIQIALIIVASLVVGATWLLPAGANENKPPGISQTVSVRLSLRTPAVMPIDGDICVDDDGAGPNPAQCVPVGGLGSPQDVAAIVLSLQYLVQSTQGLPTVAADAGFPVGPPGGHCGGRPGLDLSVFDGFLKRSSTATITIENSAGGGSATSVALPPAPDAGRYTPDLSVFFCINDPVVGWS